MMMELSLFFFQFLLDFEHACLCERELPDTERREDETDTNPKAQDKS